MTTSALGHLWRHRRLSLIAFTLSVCVALFFALRLVFATIYWSDPAHLEQRPDGWMTPGYIARSWDLDPKDVAFALGLDPEKPPRKRTLADIAADRGVPVETLIADLGQFLAKTRP